MRRARNGQTSPLTISAPLAQGALISPTTYSPCVRRATDSRMISLRAPGGGNIVVGKTLEINDLAIWTDEESFGNTGESGTLWTSWKYWAYGCQDGGQATFAVNRGGLLLVLETKIYVYPEREYPDEQVVKVLDLTSNKVGWVGTDLLNKWTERK